MKRSSQNQETETSRLTVKIPKCLHIAVKVNAAQRGIDVQDVVAEMLTKYLHERKQRGVAA